MVAYRLVFLTVYAFVCLWGAVADWLRRTRIRAIVTPRAVDQFGRSSGS